MSKSKSSLTFLPLLAALARHQAAMKLEATKGLTFAGRDAGYYESNRLIQEAYQLNKMASDVEAMIDRLKAQLDRLERLALDNNLPEALAWLQERRVALPKQFVLDADKDGHLLIREIESPETEAPCSSQS